MVRFGRLLSALAASFMVLSLGVVAVAAHEGSPPAGGPPLPEGCEVIAEGLLNPRFIAIAEDGSIYVTEAGIGGDEALAFSIEEEAEEAIGTPVPEADAEATPEGDGGPPASTRGDTGQVSVVAPDGTQSVVADGLPSYSDGAGPSGIALVDGQIYVATGGIAVEAGIEPLENENSVVAIDPATGEATLVADLGSFEEAENPDGTDVNPNLYGMDLGADGQLYVADAGGNTVYRVDPATGEFELLGIVPGPVLPGEEVPPADATPAPDAPPAPQAVPTGVHVGADGNVYVATLGAFIPGGAAVLIAQADGTFDEAATGLTTAIGVALGLDGQLYVSQFSAGEGETAPGNVVRVAADGTLEPVVENIAVPQDVAFDADGNLYVVVNSLPLGPEGPQGQILRCDGVAAA